ncbi:hypothetical protein GCM10010387_07100 [Streptomyces inusitatus]|uniref:Uncharacterized protein n=1 Tax=Streptomyces inusitatus TaxID=68221 RepID=A0A918PNK8_9ACTN|nr:hypothetical protein [Streptomyces inusitatus]GGZ17041.1 hypothetical protein GCM10010387_07100 [Streptomyces inusitatus]
MFDMYRAAGRPPLRVISDDLRSQDELYEVSRETIRRMLLGKTVPHTWATVLAVSTVLHHRGSHGRDFLEPYENEYGEPEPSAAQKLRRFWDKALDAPQIEPDPWADQPSPQPARGGYSDEPPF